MIGLIRDRSQANVDRLRALTAKGWAGMTDAEKIEWSGDPFITPTANLFPPGPYIPSGVNLEYQNKCVIATAFWDGVYLYAASIVGAAKNYEGKTLTLSVDAVTISGGGTPNLAAYWYDENGFEYAGGALSGTGSISFEVTENTAGRANLALFVYVTTDTSVLAGAITRYSGIMLNEGNARQPYVPYSAILPTSATKGAYNYSDLNRVELVVAELSRRLGLNLPTKTDWNQWDLPTQSEMARYLTNVRLLRNACPEKDTLPELPPSLYSMTYTTANDIETILQCSCDYSNESYRCGEFCCGEV